MSEIYLDNASTTRPWPEVVSAMTRAMSDGFGNASSRHVRGLAAAREVVLADEAIQTLVGNGQWKVIFTSGGTEADTLAVLGSCPRGKRDTVVSSAVEHAAVDESCRRVAERGGHHKVVSAGKRGVVLPSDVSSLVDERVALVSLTYIAGEVGTVQPVSEVAELVKRTAPRCRMHVDAVQALPQLPKLDIPEAVDMVSISAHKIHGPQGVGALLIRPDVHPRPLLLGGDQQDGVRPGTLNLPGIIGFGVAAGLLTARRQEGVALMQGRCDRLVLGILSSVSGTRTLGDPEARAPGIAVLAVGGVESEVLLHALEMRGLLASSSSACHANRRKPPRGLVDAGLRSDEGAVRLSLTLDTSDSLVDDAIGVFKDAVDSVRNGRAGEP